MATETGQGLEEVTGSEMSFHSGERQDVHHSRHRETGEAPALDIIGPQLGEREQPLKYEVSFSLKKNSHARVPV